MNQTNPADLSDPKSLFEYMGKAKTPRDTVALPTGQTIMVRGLTSHEYGTIQADMRDEDGQVDWDITAPLYLVYGVLMPDGKQAYAMSDASKILEMPRAIVQPILDKILELTGVTTDANKRLAKNWSRMAGGDSSSDSPRPSESSPGK